jgi:thiol-disulfide isomerase/thioredoxin
MIKNTLHLLLILVLLSCGTDENGENTMSPDDNFSISGQIDGAENMDVYVEALSAQGTIEVVKGKTDSKGEFSLSGNVPGMGLYQMRLGASSDRAIPLTIVPNDKITVKSNFSDFSVRPNVSGTKWAKVMNDYMRLYSVFAASQGELSELQKTGSEEDVVKRYHELKLPVDEFAVSTMKKSPENPFNIVLSTTLSPNTGFKYWNPEYLDVLKLVAEAYLKTYEGSPITATMENQVFQIEMAYEQYLAKESGSKLAPEIALKNPQGKVIKLSSLRGKYVLIDFWASWCGPCRRENPNVVKLYQKYKDRGFTIYSVSLDQDAEAWKGAITSDGLEWPNHVSDLLGWNTPMTSLYGFSGIPHTVLLDKEGNIIETGLRGTSLEQKLVELLGK